MKSFSFLKNSLLAKIVSANSLLLAIRMGFSLITQKVLAVIIGSEGIALVGDLKNVTSFFGEFSILGTANGLVKYVSEHKGDKKKLGELFSTAFVFSFLAAFLSFFVLFFYADFLNEEVFGASFDYGFVFIILSFVVPFMGINSVFNSILNGFSAYKRYFKLTLLIVIITSALIIILTLKKGVLGSLIAISVIPLIQFLIHIFLLKGYYEKYINFKHLKFSLSFKNKLLSYSLMTVVVVFFINIVDIAIRKLIEIQISRTVAGHWTAMSSISKMYMQFITAIFPLYILPKYSKINMSFDFRKEVKDVYILLIPVIFVGMIIVFFLKNIIIRILYTEEFMGVSMLFKWQLIGDFVKFIALVLSYQFLAKRQVVNFIFTELLSVFLFYFFSYYFVPVYGVEGVVLAHLVRYILYLVVVLYILRFNFLGKNRVI